MNECMMTRTAAVAAVVVVIALKGE